MHLVVGLAVAGLFTQLPIPGSRKVLMEGIASVDYTLIVPLRPGGFFSNFNQVVDHLCSDLGRGGVRAVSVDWTVPSDDIGFSFGRPADGNLWNHFFEPLAFDHFPKSIKFARGFSNRMMTQAYAMTHTGSAWRGRYHRAFAQHIRVRPHIIRRVEELMPPPSAGNFLIGAHVRHPVHQLEQIHPIPSAREFIDEVRRRIPRQGSCRVVLATDVEESAGEFRKSFGSSLIIQSNASRAATGKDLSVDAGGKPPSVALGEQVLVDALMLARCDIVVHITSNVATAVGYMNPHARLVHCETSGQRIRGTVWAIGRLLKEKRRQWLVRTGLRR